ncbi:MAG: energy transducer TonB [Terracidiphilus sp.]
MRKRRARFLALSLGLHLLLLSVTLQVIRSLRRPVVATQSPLKFYPAMLFIPGGAHVKPSPKPYGRKVPPPPPKQNPTSDLAVNATPAPPLGHLPSAQHDPTPGNGVDTQSADPAFPVFSPRPPVTDRALLPALSQQVIVDVKVSAAGDVLEATLVKGIGNALDQIVLNTVKTWRFHPATVNGSAVPTEDELIFPFDQSYPIAES